MFPRRPPFAPCWWFNTPQGCLRPPGTCRFQHVPLQQNRVAAQTVVSVQAPPEPVQPKPAPDHATTSTPAKAEGGTAPGPAVPPTEAPPPAKRRKTEAQPQKLLLEGLRVEGSDSEDIVFELKRIREVAKESWGDLTLSMSGGRMVVEARSLSKAQMMRRTLRAHGVTATLLPK